MIVSLLSSLSKQYAYSVLLILLLTGSIVPSELYLNRIAVHITGGQHVADRVARAAGLRNVGQIGGLEHYYLFEIPHRQVRSVHPSHDHLAFLSAHPEVHWFEQQRAKSRSKRDFPDSYVNTDGFAANDPYYTQQWYLHKGAYASFDMNVIPAWRKGYTGKDIVVTILDDGIERDHPDIIENYDPYASYDVNAQDSDPMPRYDASNENRHGTRCAGEVSATANNSLCAVGIAYNSKIGGVRMLDGDVFDAVEAASLSFNRSHVHIYSASWGPDDDGRVVDGPGPLAKKAFEDGIRYGRDGKGSIFVWASGNGGSSQDSCNCDGYANSIYTLSISSTSERGTKPWYLEECSSTIATTYSSGAYNEKQIVTVDLHKHCTTSHTGTSASAPLAAGIVALILEANPNLTWRDVQYITLMTARPEPMVDGQWITNGLGRKVSLRYGYGLMDASRMVDLALLWKTVPEKHICVCRGLEQPQDLDGERLTKTLSTDGCSGQDTEVRYLEHVQCEITLTHQRRGDIVIYLTSPQGTRSTLLPRRPNDLSNAGFNEWPFLSVHFWGEDPRGQWTLEIENGFPYNQGLGQLVDWQLMLHGTKEQPVRLRNESRKSSESVHMIHPTSFILTRSTLQTINTNNGQKSNISVQGCHAECKEACSGPGPADCVACKHLTNETDGVCLATCPDGTYTDDKMCRACHSSCRTCWGPVLKQCLTCFDGMLLDAKNGICSVQCSNGTYNDVSGCLPCHKSCLNCKGPSENNCTACWSRELPLPEGLCFRANTWLVYLEKSMQGIVLGLVLVSSILLLTIGIVVVVYAYQKRKLCWSYNNRYDKLPCQEMDEEENKFSIANGFEYKDNPCKT